jgi:hypothetical protein
VFEFSLSNPSAVDTTYTFTFTNGTAGSADYTTTSQTGNCTWGATTGTVSVPTTADTIAESMRLYIASGTASATGTINDNDAAPTVATITPASATEGSPAVFEFSLSNPSAVDTTYTFTFTNGTAGSADYTSQTVTVPAGATTGTVGVPTTADTIDENNETLHCLWNASATGTMIMMRQL